MVLCGLGLVAHHGLVHLLGFHVIKLVKVRLLLVSGGLLLLVLLIMMSSDLVVLL